MLGLFGPHLNVSVANCMAILSMPYPAYIIRSNNVVSMLAHGRKRRTSIDSMLC